MGCFSNSTEAALYEEKYCNHCVHGEKNNNCCAVWMLHFLHGYDGNNPSIYLSVLIPRNEAGERAGGNRCFTCSAKCSHKYRPDSFSKPRKGYRIKSKGYTYIMNKDHPRANVSGYVAEHIIVAERMIGRKLNIGEIAHHINGIRDDNREENLLVMTEHEHKHYHTSGEKNVSSKLTRETVRKIRALYHTGRYYQYELAQMFNVSQTNISSITRLVTWGNI